MIALIDLYRKQLSKINGFSASTVKSYTLSIKAFCEFAISELKTNPINVKASQLLKWILYLKHTGIGYSRIENHHYALKSFFAFLKSAGHIPSNPAQALPLLITRRRQVTKPISARNAVKLLDSFDQSYWHGLRNYTMVAVLWALGLRTSELTGLRVKDFETGHGKKIALLRIRGKNKKQRALFVVDRLFDDICRYLAHPQAPKKKMASLFPAQPNIAISNNRLQNIVKQQAQKIGIKSRVTPRSFRHAFATEMYHQKVPLNAIGHMMGHDSVAETSIYVHVSDKLKQLALDNIHISRRTSWL